MGGLTIIILLLIYILQALTLFDGVCHKNTPCNLVTCVTFPLFSSFYCIAAVRKWLCISGLFLLVEVGTILSLLNTTTHGWYFMALIPLFPACFVLFSVLFYAKGALLPQQTHSYCGNRGFFRGNCSLPAVFAFCCLTFFNLLPSALRFAALPFPICCLTN